jgi:hypothetical protein
MVQEDVGWSKRTWDGTNPPDDRIVAVLSHRLSGKRVRDFVEQLYIVLAKYSQSEKLACAKAAKGNPYPALLEDFERITCGHNPWLYARRVTDLEVREGCLRWREPLSVAEMRRRLKEHGTLR